MNKINVLIDAIKQIEEMLCDEKVNSEEILAQILKKLFNQDVQSLNDLENILIAQYKQSGLSTIDEYIDFLLYRLDSNFDLELHLNYQINDLILSDMNYQMLYHNHIDSTDSEELGKQCRKRQ